MLRVTVYVGPTLVNSTGTAIGIACPNATDIIVGTEYVIFTYPTPNDGWGAIRVMREIAAQTGLPFLASTRGVSSRSV